MKSERIIVVPQVIGDTIWAKGGKVSESYLREQAQVVNMLFLSKTPSSAKEQNDSLLKITAPNFYGVLKKNLNEEENLLFNQGASYLFLPSKTKVDASQMMVITEGERSTYISGKLLSTVKEKYTYRFTFNGTRLLLSGVAREEVGGV